MTDKPDKPWSEIACTGFPIDAIAYQQGVAAAQADIVTECYRLFWQTRGAWGDFFTALMQQRFGVHVVHTSDIISGKEVSHETGYNDFVISHLDKKFGAGSFQRAWDEVREYREASYQKWIESEAKRLDSGGKD